MLSYSQAPAPSLLDCDPGRLYLKVHFGNESTLASHTPLLDIGYQSYAPRSAQHAYLPKPIQPYDPSTLRYPSLKIADRDPTGPQNSLFYQMASHNTRQEGNGIPLFWCQPFRTSVTERDMNRDVGERSLRNEIVLPGRGSGLLPMQYRIERYRDPRLASYIFYAARMHAKSC
jgi:hypothetical protein